MNVYIIYCVLAIHFFPATAGNRQQFFNNKALEYEIPCGVSKYTSSNRIVGGVPANLHEFPWAVSIQIKVKETFTHNCGGAIIHSKFILTAGHCLKNYPLNLMLVKVGINNIKETNEHEQERTIADVYFNGYDDDNFDKDIALIKLNKSLTLEEGYVVPGCVPQNPVDISVTKQGVVAGWGVLKNGGKPSNEMMKVTLPFIEYSECESIYEKKGYDYYMHDCTICTLSKEEKDACQGDSGGALMCVDSETSKINICGIVSWGVGCGNVENPGVYTEVSCFYDWITKTIEDKAD